MSIIPTPPLVLAHREEWPDADFDFTEDEPIHASDNETAIDDDEGDDDDWDAEMDLGKTGGATVRLGSVNPAATPATPRVSGSTQMITIRPPISSVGVDDDDEEEEENVSTIKGLDTLKSASHSSTPATIDEDFESDFALPADMKRLSLRPLSLHHQSSRSSFEWGDKDQTVSSQSSDAYSTLGFAASSPSSATSASASLPETEAEDDEDDLDGLVIPSAIFESAKGTQHLAKLLEMKKKLPAIDERSKITGPDPEDDFEIGLVIDDDADFSASRLRSSQSAPPKRTAYERSKSAPATRPPSSSTSRGPSRRTKSPTSPPPSSIRHFQTLSVATSISAGPSVLSPRTSSVGGPPSSFLAPKSASLRGQKSHNNIKPASPPNTRSITRKASLSSLIGASAVGVDVAGSSAVPVQRYEAPTAASRAKSQHHHHLSHTSSASRLGVLDYGSVQQRTPSGGAPVAPDRGLTMPASSGRLKSRPSISGVFPGAVPGSGGGNSRTPSGSGRATSPLPPTASSSASISSANARSPPPFVGPAPKVMRKPKRVRAYGDGTELDGFDDLPTDGDQESRFRVQAKGHGNRAASISGPIMSTKTLRSVSSTIKADDRPVDGAGPAPGLKRTARVELGTKQSSASLSMKKTKKTASGSPKQKRKPTLIRNLGGAGAPKVVGEMKWNPQTLRWEGNDQALRDFDAVTTSTRPALITHLTGSSIGSPLGFANGARKVGNMIFDPTKMCWISALAPEDDEPDVFADLADDEQDEDGWYARGGTIRAGTAQSVSAAPSDAGSSRFESPSPARSSHSRAASEAGSEHGGSSNYDRGSRASLCVADVDESFRTLCREAEARHRQEMAGWRVPHESSYHTAPSRGFLYEIRVLATRQY